MADPFVAEIRVFGFNFAPTGWAQCNGQLLPISQNTALFSLVGTFYGGDGKSTFGLPDLQGAAAVHQGQGQGLSEYFIGEQEGVQTVTLLTSEMPLHNHNVMARAATGDLQQPGPDRALTRSGNGTIYEDTTNVNLVTMAPQALSPAGGSFPHNNMQPILTLNFCIALQGIFPPRG
jgi:microcystin-dependent protein